METDARAMDDRRAQKQKSPPPFGSGQVGRRNRPAENGRPHRQPAGTDRGSRRNLGGVLIFPEMLAFVVKCIFHHRQGATAP
jgi:hypothetical protein